MNDTIKIMLVGTFCIITIIIVADVTSSMFGHKTRGGINQSVNTVQSVQAMQISNTSGINGVPNVAQQQMIQATQSMNGRQFITANPEATQATNTPQPAQWTQSTASQTTPAGTTQTKVESVPGITKTTQSNRIGKVCDKKKCIYQTEIVEVTCYAMTNSCVQTKIGKGTETELLQ